MAAFPSIFVNHTTWIQNNHLITTWVHPLSALSFATKYIECIQWSRLKRAGSSSSSINLRIISHRISISFMLWSLHQSPPNTLTLSHSLSLNECDDICIDGIDCDWISMISLNGNRWIDGQKEEDQNQTDWNQVEWVSVDAMARTDDEWEWLRFV